MAYHEAAPAASHDNGGESMNADQAQRLDENRLDENLLDEMLVEEVSIDGMCGVY
jgi:mycofactocin precursor